MTDMRIAIACQDDGLRKLAYSLFPDHPPDNLLRFCRVEDLIRGINQGQFDVVVLDEGFEDPDREFVPMVELNQARMPVVALCPRAPSYSSPASKQFTRTATATFSIRLDLPTTAAGMEIAIDAAIDAREGAARPEGADYGRETHKARAHAAGLLLAAEARETQGRAWPNAWQTPAANLPDALEVDEQARRVADEITGVKAVFPEPKPMAEAPPLGRPDAQSRALRRAVETIKEAPPTEQRTDYGEITNAQRIALAQREKARGIQGGAPADDPMDALIEAAKAIVIESWGKAGHVNARGISVYAVPTDLLVALKDTLSDAGYAPW